MPPTALEAVTQLAQSLGRPEHDLVILAEGNTSAKQDDASFWVKASGFSLNAIEPDGFVQVEFERILAAFERDLADADIRNLLAAARITKTERMPSVETFMHAYLLSLPGVEIVGHTHPAPLLSLLCREDAEQLARLRIFPDEVVCCGPAAAFVPYCDPGLPLARAIRAEVERYVHEFGALPKTIWLANHGLIAIGKNAAEVEAATFMSAKAARIWLGALAAGSRHQTLSPAQIERIHTRPDEHYRQRILASITKQ